MEKYGNADWYYGKIILNTNVSAYTQKKIKLSVSFWGNKESNTNNFDYRLSDPKSSLPIRGYQCKRWSS